MPLSESAIRRRLAKAGYRLEKTPSRHWSRSWYGPGYMVIDGTNTVIIGAYHRPYDSTLEHVREFVADL